jgi:hypothetical protein
LLVVVVIWARCWRVARLAWRSARAASRSSSMSRSTYTMLGSGGGGGLSPAWPRVSGAILEKSGLVRNNDKIREETSCACTILITCIRNMSSPSIHKHIMTASIGIQVQHIHTYMQKKCHISPAPTSHSLIQQQHQMVSDEPCTTYAKGTG